MSFELLQLIRDCQQRISVLEELIKQQQIAQKKQTLSLPIKAAKTN